MNTKPTLHRFGKSGMTIKELLSPNSTDLDLLSYLLVEVAPGYISSQITYPDHEVLLTGTGGRGEVIVDGQCYEISQYDMLYVPENTPFQLIGRSQEPFQFGMAMAPSQAKGVPVHVSYEVARKDPKRLRKMANKEVFIMFGEESQAQYLVAGLVFFEPYTRSFPAHKHSDQEEVYHFLDGNGSVEIYPSEEQKTFVYNVQKDDVVTIPLEHYHPVFTQQEKIAWAWIIAGERYWVGDRDADWMGKAKEGK